MRVWWFRQVKVGSRRVDVDSIPRENLPQVPAVNDAQRVEAVDARRYTLGLDIGQTAERDREIIAVVLFGNSHTGGLDITNGEAKLLPHMRAASLVERMLFSRSVPVQ